MIRLLILGLFLLLVGLMLLPELALVFHAAFYLLFGWIFFLARVMSQVSFRGAGFLTAGVCLVLVTAGAHGLFRWFVQRPSESAPAARTWSLRSTLALVALFVFMFIAGISVVGVSHQTAWLLFATDHWMGSSNRDRMYRQFEATNSVKSASLGLDHHKQTDGRIPAGMKFDSLGRVLHGWPALILPYLESTASIAIDLDRPWNDPVNDRAIRHELPMLLNQRVEPTRDANGYPLNHYAGNRQVLGSDWGMRARDFGDGIGHTLLLGDAAGNYRPWGYPYQVRDAQLGINRSLDGFGNANLDGATFSMADGSARFISNQIDPEVFRALATPNGGETIDDDDWQEND